MTTLREAAIKALEAMSSFESGTNGLYEGEFAQEIAALRAALADGDKLSSVEPVAWYHVPYPNNGFSPMVIFRKQHEPSMYGAVVPLYLAPPQRPAEPVTIAEWWANKERKPLSEDEIKKLLIESAGMTVQFGDVDLRFSRAIELAHGIK